MMCFVYLIRCGDSSFYKIGVSDNPTTRLIELQKANPHPLFLEVTCGFTSKTLAVQAEASAHQALANRRMHGEWFDLTPKMVNHLKHDMISCDV